jgi:hypothetical protein
MGSTCRRCWGQPRIWRRRGTAPPATPSTCPPATTLRCDPLVSLHSGSRHAAAHCAALCRMDLHCELQARLAPACSAGKHAAPFHVQPWLMKCCCSHRAGGRPVAVASAGESAGHRRRGGGHSHAAVQRSHQHRRAAAAAEAAGRHHRHSGQPAPRQQGAGPFLGCACPGSASCCGLMCCGDGRPLGRHNDVIRIAEPHHH